MARTIVDQWLVEEQGSEVIRVVSQVSAIEQYAKPEPMKSYTKTIPRSAAVGISVVAKGSAYAEDVSTVDEITIVARKFGTVIRIAEEDIEDELVSILDEKKFAWANAYANAIDNAAIGTTAAVNGTTVPFTSVYKTVRTSDASVGYTADANYVPTAGTAANITYAQLRKLVSTYETSPFYDDAAGLVIAHPSFKDQIRSLTDTQGRPLFLPSLVEAAPDKFFGYDIKFSLGARTSAVATNTPTGNPLMILANRNLLRLGKRSGPESVVIDGRNGTSALTDETLLKMRARRGFVVGDARGVNVLELLP